MTEQEQSTDSLFDDEENENALNNSFQLDDEFEFDMGQDMIPTEDDFKQAFGEI